jgi:hypothetical protein
MGFGILGKKRTSIRTLAWYPGGNSQWGPGLATRVWNCVSFGKRASRAARQTGIRAIRTLLHGLCDLRGLLVIRILSEFLAIDRVAEHFESRSLGYCPAQDVAAGHTGPEWQAESPVTGQVKRARLRGPNLRVPGSGVRQKKARIRKRQCDKNSKTTSMQMRLVTAIKLRAHSPGLRGGSVRVRGPVGTRQCGNT